MRRRAFHWREVAAALHMTRSVARAAFWREIKRPRSKSAKAQSAVIVTSVAPDSDDVKRGKPTASR